MVPTIRVDGGPLKRRRHAMPFDRRGIATTPEPVTFQVSLTDRGSRAGSSDAVDRVPEWVSISVDRLRYVASLPPNWAGGRCARVDSRLLPVAFRIIAEVVPSRPEYVPQVVPTVQGGLQLEWHLGGFDLEVSIDATGEVFVDYCTADESNCWDGRYSDLHLKVARILRESADGT